MDAANPRLSNALITALALVCAYGLAFYWNLEKPCWAGFTVFMVSLPTVGQSLLKGLLRIAGTLLGAAVALLLYGFLHQHRLALLTTLSLYLCLCAVLTRTNRAYGYFYFNCSTVTSIITLMAVQGTESIFQLATHRTEETILGIVVYTTCRALFSGRPTVSDLPSQAETLWQRHQALLALSCETVDAASIHERYAAVTKTASDAALLLPSAQLEDSRVWCNRHQWAELFNRSADLARLQRRWASLASAMRDPATGQISHHFAERTARLEAAMTETGLCDAHNLPENLPQTPPDNSIKKRDGMPNAAKKASTSVLAQSSASVSPQLSASVPAQAPGDRVLEISRQRLFQRQLALILRLRELSAFLLHAGPPPAAPRLPDARSNRPNPAEMARGGVQTFLTFWIAAPIWMLLHPPGSDNVIFLMLAVMLGVAIVLAGEINPARLFLSYCQGTLFAAVFYILVYPHLARLELFLGLMFILAFVIAYAFHTPAQTLNKLAYLMPWLNMSDFTNVPTYEALPFLSSLFTLLLGAGLAALARYVFFSSNNQALFLQQQNAFFQAVGTVLTHMEVCRSSHPTLAARLCLWRDRIRVRCLAAQLASLSLRLNPRFIAPAAAGHLALGLDDIARTVDSLALLTPKLPIPFSIPANEHGAHDPGQTPIQTQSQTQPPIRPEIQNMTPVKTQHENPPDQDCGATGQTFDTEIARAEARVAILKEAALHALSVGKGPSGQQPAEQQVSGHQLSEHQLPGTLEGTQKPKAVLWQATALIGRLAADMAEYRDAARLANWRMTQENRF